MRRILLSSAAALALSPLPLAATAFSASAACPAVTVADMKGVAAGAYPQQFELATFEKNASCNMTFSQNPQIEALNGTIQGNGDLAPVAERLPSEPLVVAPYRAIGAYGGTLDALSNATEAGTSDFLSLRHVNLVRYSDDLQTIVPNVAKSWEWNDDYTQITFTLREGHKWSDGEPFTSADVAFWYQLSTDPKIYEKPKDFVLVAGEKMTVETPDATTVVFKLPAPKPGLLAHFATSYSQPFQPRHFLGQFHPDVSADADAKAKEMGFEDGYAAIAAYYGNSDWTDTPSPYLSQSDRVAGLPKAVVPTLESHVIIGETAEGRQLVANPYFFQVDTTGQQLPYISRHDELYVNENEVRLLKLANGEVDYKSQSVQLPAAPMLLENREKGGYAVQLKPTVAMPTFSFNVTHPDEEKRQVFGDVTFRQAMSLAMNRGEINETVYFGQGEPKQFTGFSPRPEFVDEALTQSFAEYDADKAMAMLDELGLVDKDGDGFRDLPSGKPLTLNLQFATQGAPGELVQLVSQNWKDVGINSTVKEVTPDEYRSQQSSNQLDVGIWAKGQPTAIVLGSNELFVPPFENYFGHRTGMLWAEWVDSDGASGVEPPQYVKDMMKDVDAFQSAAPGSPEAAEIGARLAKTMTDAMLFIGTVQAPAPIVVSNKLKNVPEFQTWSYEYYRTYPYRATQWFLDPQS